MTVLDKPKQLALAGGAPAERVALALVVAKGVHVAAGVSKMALAHSSLAGACAQAAGTSNKPAVSTANHVYSLPTVREK
jgi:hypothetical protein